MENYQKNEQMNKERQTKKEKSPLLILIQLNLTKIWVDDGFEVSEPYSSGRPDPAGVAGVRTLRQHERLLGLAKPFLGHWGTSRATVETVGI